jgi:hypothetical protein
VSSGPDIDQLCAVLAECITAIGAATAAYEAAEAATRRDHDIVLAVAGNNPGRTLSRSLADLEDAIKHIRRERGRLARAKAGAEAAITSLVGSGAAMSRASLSGTRTADARGGDRWSDPEARRQWVDQWLADPTHLERETHAGPEYDFQRRYAGEYQVKLRIPDGTQIKADGLTVDPDTVVALDTKYVVAPGGGRQLYEGGRPEFMYRQFDHEMERYAKVLREVSNPVSRLRLITNSERAAEFLAARARKILGDGIDLVVIVKEN